MRLSLPILALFHCCFQILYGQDKDWPGMDLDKVALVNQRESYITFPMDIGNLEPLMFEANVSPSFIIRKRMDSKLMGVLTPQIIIRMYNAVSYPVKTPSYIPQIAAYYLLSKGATGTRMALFGKLAHHSNGQNGAFYNTDGTVNLESGNFATNYFELGLVHTSFEKAVNATKFLKTSLEIHPKSWMLEELQGHYSGLRWHNAFYAYKLPVKMGHRGSIKADFSLKLEATWFMDQLNDWDLFTIKRLHTRLTVYYHPKFLEDIGFFMEYYHGTDYYNMYFQHRLDVIRFGIMTEVLRF
ncbi:hypothetical protein [Flagellimonas beolgyonensis]|uniref:hypothetical protein n=1 Tax=Flagellimonas beolgyonensis TaxID=864064 RepID=UPI000F8C3587|nr:hypothetical protein [Allomuricauda beolgyonensis]